MINSSESFFVIPPLQVIIPREKRAQIIMGLDPGQTTGACLMQGGELLYATQLKTPNLRDAISTLQAFLEEHSNANVVVYEDYRVYAWKASTHAFNELHTAKVIGAIETLVQLQPSLRDTSISVRMAQPVKSFCTDAKLKAWGLWIPGKQHARDAIRHAVFEAVQRT